MRELHLRKSFIAITLLTIIFVAFGIVGMPIDVEAGLNDSVPVGYTPIKTISDLYAVNDNPSGNYILMNDIDMSETRKGGSWDLGSGWEPIKEFSGIFDGNGHTLLNLHMYIASEDNYNYVTLGLFSEVDGKVINLGLSNIDIIFEKSDEYDYYDRVRLGVITGILDRSGEINGCYTEGTVSIKSGFRFDTFIGGGIAGSSDGNIKNCYSAVEYICDDNVYSYLGYEDAMYNCGLCGFSSYGTIENCYFAGATDNSEYCITADAYSYQINNVYFLSSNLRDSDGYGKPLSSIQMQRQEMFQGFDFTNDWIIDPNSGYPYPQLLNCMQVKINSAKLSSLPSKREYLTTDKEITINGIYWDITYENGKSSKIPLTQEMLEYEMKPGEQTVKVKWGKYQEEFTIKVKKNVPTLEIEEYDIKKVGDTVTLKPKTNSNGKISYSSDSYGKATVNSSGKVVFNQAGRIPVTISVDETSQFAAIEKTIYFDVRGIVPYIKIKEEFSAKAGTEIALNVKTDSDGAVTYISNRPDVAEVDENGLVTCKKAGSATITIRTSLTLLYEPSETNVLIAVEPTESSITNTINLYVGQIIRLETAFESYPFNIKNAKFDVKKGAKLVRINSDGLKALKKGKAVVTAAYKDYIYTCEINISKAPKAKASTVSVNGVKIKLPKGFFAATDILNKCDDLKYFYNKKNEDILLIQVDSSLSDTMYLSRDEAEFVVERIIGNKDILLEKMTGEIKNLVSESDYSSKNILSSYKETQKGLSLLVSLQKKDGSTIYFNQLITFVDEKMIVVSFITYDKSLMESTMDYIVKKNKL